MDITTHDLVEFVRKAASEGGHTDGTITLRDVVESTGWGEDKSREAIRKMIKNQTLVPTKVTRVRMDGIVTRVTGYRFIGEGA